MSEPNGTGDEGLAPMSFHLSLMARLRAYFFAGILITAPIAITVYIAWIVVRFIDERVADFLPEAYNPKAYLPFNLPGIGLIIVIVALTTVGWLTAGILGRLFLRISESLLHRMPFVRSVYGAVKQVFETLFAPRVSVFRQVVLVEFPRNGLWRIGFVTGTTPGQTQDVVAGGLVNVFIPGSPNATSGFLVLVPPKDVVEIDLTTEEALKLIVSGGIAVPPRRSGTAAQPDRTSLTAASRSNK